MNYIYLSYMILLAFLLTACDTELESIQPLIDEGLATLIPDRRLIYADVSAELKDSTITLHGETTDAKTITKLKSGLAAKGYSIIDSINTLPTDILPYGVVVNSVGNVRSKPGHSQELSTQVLLGYILRVYKQEDNWLFIKTPDGYLGWIDAGAVHLIDDNKLEIYSIIPKIIFTEATGKIYSKPSLDAVPLTDVTSGAILQFKGQRGAFTRVKLADDREGYVRSEYTEDASAYFSGLNYNPQNVTREAQKYHGHPYLWGGSSPKGMDCSGFTQHVYRMFNRVLLRDASQQFRQGELITDDRDKLSDLQEGDLLFFGRRLDSTQRKGLKDSPKITHVAIYLGDGEMIHSTGRVKIESLNPDADNFAKNRYDTFIAARRIIGDDSIPLLDTTRFYGLLSTR